MPPESANSEIVNSGSNKLPLWWAVVLVALVAAAIYAVYTFYFKDIIAGLNSGAKSEEDKITVLDTLLNKDAATASEKEKTNLVNNLISTSTSSSGPPKQSTVPQTQETYDAATAEKIKLLESLKSK
ncbi:MAG: hypothetical protein AAB355_01435 [Patescibacteria group bacterium]